MGLHLRRTSYILPRDGHLCQYCKGESGDAVLQKHHLQTKSEGGSDFITNLVTVCETCHGKINKGCTELYHRSTERLCIPDLGADDLLQVKQTVKRLLLGEIREIAMSARRSEMQAGDGTPSPDPALNARIEIGKTLRKALTNLVPWSLVFDEFVLKNIYFDHEYWLLSDIAYRRYTWVIDPLDGMEAYRNLDDNNYRVTVALFDRFSPLVSFTYSPEYEIDGAAGALFETGGEESPLCGLFSSMKASHEKFLRSVAHDVRQRLRNDRCLMLGETGSLGNGRYFVIACIETRNYNELRDAVYGKADADEMIAAMTDHNFRISYIAADKAYVEEALANDENALHGHLRELLLDRVVERRCKSGKTNIMYGNKDADAVWGLQRYIDGHPNCLRLHMMGEDLLDACMVQAAGCIAGAVYSYYADGDTKFLKWLRHRIDFAATYPNRKITYRSENGTMVRARITYV
jgi:hypothetical protein